MLNQFRVNFNLFSQEISNRFDVDFIGFQNRFSVKNYYSFNDLFSIKKENQVNITYLDDNFYYSEIGNILENGEVEPIKLNFNERNVEDEDYYKKIEKGDIIQVKKGEILISKVRPYLKKYVYIDENNNDIFYTSAFIHLKPKKIGKILYYSLRTIFYDNLITISRQGKGYPTISENDFQYLKFDKEVIDRFLSKQNQIVSKIEPIEQKIKNLKSTIKDQKDIINEVFAREFGFDKNLADEFGKGMTALTQSLGERKLKVNTIKFNEIIISEILRFSTRFHNEPTKKLMKILDNLKTIEVNKVVESYEKGLQPKYDADGIIDVIKITNLKNQYINFLETEKVSQEYYNSLSEEKKLKENDIIICATGKGSLGKIDLFESENEAITSVDNYIIRLKQNINFLFFVYFFRSILGYFQIERDYTGTTNQIHLYWEQIGDFKIPNISFKEQQRIVNEIKFELDKQEQIRKDIEKERSKIDELIEESIRNFG